MPSRFDEAVADLDDVEPRAVAGDAARVAACRRWLRTRDDRLARARAGPSSAAASCAACSSR
jgi:hypothetical protein